MFFTCKNPGMSQERELFHYVQSYSGDGFETINPALGKGLDF